MRYLTLALVLALSLSPGAQAQTVEPGAAVPIWVTPTFAAGDFVGNGAMDWTVAAGDVLTHRYMMLTPTTMIIQLSLENTDIGGTPNNLLTYNIPNNKRALNRNGGAILIADNSAENSGRYLATAAGTTILLFQQVPGTSWTSGTSVCEIEFVITLEVEERP